MCEDRSSAKAQEGDGRRGFLCFEEGRSTKIDRESGVFWGGFQVFLGLLSRFWMKKRVGGTERRTKVVLCPRLGVVAGGGGWKEEGFGNEIRNNYNNRGARDREKTAIWSLPIWV